MPAMTLEYARKHRDKLRKELLEIAARQRDIANRGASGEEISAQEEAEYFGLEKRAEQHKTDLEYALLDVQEGEQLLEDEEAIRLANERAGIGHKGTRSMSNVESRYGVPLSENGRFVDLPDAKKNATIEDFGSYARALMLGEQRVQSEAIAAEGGINVPIAYSAPILDLAINQAQVKAANARFVPMESKTQQVGKLESDPTPAWRLEGNAIAESSAVFSSITLTARSLAVHVRVSMELLEDSRPDFNAILGTSLARAFAQEMDRVALFGSGSSPEPRGLKNTSGVSITNFVGANGGQINATNGNYNAFVDTVGRLRSKNYSPTGIIYSPRTEATFGKLTDTVGQPLAEPSYLRDAAPHLPSGQIPTNLSVGTSSDASDYITGDFSYLLVGVRSAFQIQPISDAFLVSNGQLAFVGTLRMDVQVARPAAFEILTGIRA